jgi:hypothetical protein
MSEKIYACLLRLFPSHFREVYGDEARQLFRDRARDETGFVPRVRLWLDWLADLAIAVPRQYHIRPAFTGAAQQPFDSVPAFFVLVDESPRSGALIFGCALSMMALSLFSILLVHPGNRRPLIASAHQGRPATDLRQSISGRTTRQAQGPAEEVITNASHTKPGEAKPNDSQSKTFFPPDSFRFPEARPPQLQDAAERKRLMNAVIDTLKKHYVDQGLHARPRMRYWRTRRTAMTTT